MQPSTEETTPTVLPPLIGQLSVEVRVTHHSLRQRSSSHRGALRTRVAASRHSFSATQFPIAGRECWA